MAFLPINKGNLFGGLPCRREFIIAGVLDISYMLPETHHTYSDVPEGLLISSRSKTTEAPLHAQWT